MLSEACSSGVGMTYLHNSNLYVENSENAWIVEFLCLILSAKNINSYKTCFL